MKRGYQHSFSEMHYDAMHHREGREKKARTMIAVLRDYFTNDLKNLYVLDIGSSTGIIDNFLSDHLKELVGIDIDEKAVAFAQQNFKKSNLSFFVDDAMNLNFNSNTFDVVICAQIYEHVPDQEKLLSEIFRVLKPRGVCYFAAGNRLDIIEHHYNLPFLSILPKPLAHLYLRVSGRGKYYYEKHLSYWGLKKLVKNFQLIDYTRKIINAPEFFFAEYMLQQGSLKKIIAQLVVNYAYWLCPGYVWILKK